MATLMDRPPQGSEVRAWTWAGLCAASIFAVIPLARRLEAWVTGASGPEAFLALAVAAALAAGAASLALLRRAGALDPRRTLCLGGAALAYAAGAWMLRAQPVEAMHLVQYGVLGLLAFRALGFRVRDLAVYPAAVAVGASVGVLDEGIQWLTPQRVWDLRDIRFNALGTAGVQLALLGAGPAWVSRRFSAHGLQLLCRWALVLTLLLGASLLNTPPRIAWLGRSIPGLGFLLDHGDTMLEYGFMHERPDLQRFRSRFTLEELQRRDAARAEEVGPLLAANLADPDPEAYRRFLRRHSPIRDPFLHELRVHLFRRDRYRARAAANRADPVLLRGSSTVALREDRILALGFVHSLSAADASLPPEERDRLEAEQDPERQYESPVSRGLVTRVREGQVALGLAVLLAGLLGAHHACGRGRERSAPPPTPGDRVGVRPPRAS